MEHRENGMFTHKKIFDEIALVTLSQASDDELKSDDPQLLSQRPASDHESKSYDPQLLPQRLASDDEPKSNGPPLLPQRPASDDELKSDDPQLISQRLPSDDKSKSNDPALLPQGLDSVLDDMIDEKARPPLRYLSIFDEKELKELEITYSDENELNPFEIPHANVTRFDMDKKIEEHSVYFPIKKIENGMALLIPVILIPYFRLIAGSDGIQAFFSKILNINISTQLAYRINIPLVLSSVICLSILTSPTKAALRETIDYAFRPSYFRRIQNACSSPGALLPNMVHQIILNVTNTTASMSMLLYVWDDVYSLPRPINGFLMASIVYFGKKFFDNYYNRSFFEGLKLLSNKKYPYLLQEMLQGNIALPINVLLQSISAILLRTYPLYLFLVSKISEKLQLSKEVQPIFISLTLTMITLQSIIMFYSSTIHIYFDARVKLDDRYENASARNAHEEAILKKINAVQLFKNDPIVLVSLLYLTFSGGILGVEALASSFDSFMHESLAATILSGTLGAVLLGSLYYRAERNHFKNLLMLNESQQEDDPARQRKSCCEKVSQAISKIINGFDGLGNVVATMGTVRMGSLGGVSLLAFFRALTLFQFNGKKYANTIAGYCVKSPSVSTVLGTFFNRAPPPKKLCIETPSENQARTFKPSQ
jgi:hypothetical protein